MYINCANQMTMLPEFRRDAGAPQGVVRNARALFAKVSFDNQEDLRAAAFDEPRILLGPTSAADRSGQISNCFPFSDPR